MTAHRRDKEILENIKKEEEISINEDEEQVD
jgi:hypothetical protein